MRSSNLKECLIQLCDASLACLFGLAPSAAKKKKPSGKEENDTYLQSSEVCRGGTDSQGVGVVSAQLDTYLKIHRIDEL